MSKIFCSEAAFRIVDRAMQTLGGMGITDDTLVEDYLEKYVHLEFMMVLQKYIDGQLQKD